MVMLHMKRSEDEQFLFETTVEASVEATITEMVNVHNTRLRIHRLKLEGEELAEYGPMKQPDQQGIDEFSETPVEKGPYYKQDPTGRRTGNAAAPEAVVTLRKTLADADSAAHKSWVEKKKPLKQQELLEQIDLIRGAVMICFPMGLPEWDHVREAIEDNEELEGSNLGLSVLDVDSAQLWWAGKEMMRGNKLAVHVGKNEKTKIICKLQKKGAGAPQREPVVDAETQKQMMSFYYKKQEEQKRLEENTEDDYTNSAWASSNSLKKHFAGVSGDIKIR
ncbi:hypothetical protein CYMTET_27494 [Cymbomonas tetramitiformis]|uniref:Uncharacterized protein n=1 Tax=Cymbomonas tetramitiformis TaxID=36881 RepID=A0AAE0KX56_9CHLO|nr:hypothetical protein CYMTET_27494 [Cymbomonas tetramitiformis]|eukprot:gene20262-24263_t